VRLLRSELFSPSFASWLAVFPRLTCGRRAVCRVGQLGWWARSRGRGCSRSASRPMSSVGFHFEVMLYSARWTLRMWSVKMVGEALEHRAPFGLVGRRGRSRHLLPSTVTCSLLSCGTASPPAVQTINSLAPDSPCRVESRSCYTRILFPRLEAIDRLRVYAGTSQRLVLAALHLRWLSHLLGPGCWEDMGRGERTVRRPSRPSRKQLAVFVRLHPTRFFVALSFAPFGTLAVRPHSSCSSYFHFSLANRIADCWLIEAVVVLCVVPFLFPPHRQCGRRDTLMCGC